MSITSLDEEKHCHGEIGELWMSAYIRRYYVKIDFEFTRSRRHGDNRRHAPYLACRPSGARFTEFAGRTCYGSSGAVTSGSFPVKERRNATRLSISEKLLSSRVRYPAAGLPESWRGLRESST